MNDFSEPLTFPNVSGSNLEGRKFYFPKDFEGKLNIIVVAFKREQTSLIETWAEDLADIERKNPTVRFYELPVLSRTYSPIRWWIDGGMRAGISDSESRKRTITVYTAKNIFKNHLRIPSEDTIHVLLVDKSGTVLWQTQGSLTKEKIGKLRKTLEENIT